MKRFLAATTLLAGTTIGVACGGDDAPNNPEPTATIDFSYDLETFDLPNLVYWDNLYSTSGGPPRPLEELVIEMAESGNPQYKPYLVELALYFTPFREIAADALVGDPNASVGDVLDYIGERGRKEPSDDDAEFLRFKQLLMGSIIPDFYEFLDPNTERTISAQEVVWGGVATDGIPPLDEPNFISAEEASEWLCPPTRSSASLSTATLAPTRVASSIGTRW